MAPKMLGRDSSRSKSQLGVGALMLGFVFLSWIVLLAGVSAVQHEGTQDIITDVQRCTAVHLVSRILTCCSAAAAAHNRNALEFEWWVSVNGTELLSRRVVLVSHDSCCCRSLLLSSSW